MPAEPMLTMDVLFMADMVGIHVSAEEVQRLIRRQVRDGLTAKDVENILRQWQQDARDRYHPAHRDPTAQTAVGNVSRRA